MNLAQLLDRLKADDRFLRNVNRWEIIPPEAGTYADYPPSLDDRLVDVPPRRGGGHSSEARRDRATAELFRF